ncbi:YfiR family protein, partial [Cupriavidus sp. 2SB]|uniref:YfiR family protein n=1 Tax=Cupriavidus sp. 2SB TaxID=2502199 RepID=UPI0020180751
MLAARHLLHRLARPALPALLAVVIALPCAKPAVASSPPASAASAPAPSLAAPAPTSSGSALPAGPSRPEAVARVVMSLLSYARWPEERETVKLCVDTGARYAAKLMEGGTLSTGRLVESRRVDMLADALIPGCDALYIGVMDEARRRKLTSAFVGKPVLVIAEEDFECEGGSMFCLSIRDSQVSFRINLDAIARSGIHVHPGVLQ